VGGEIEEGSASGPGLRDREAWGEQAAGRARRVLVHGAGPVNR
jgi:hypothetical protein